jgi:acyl-CoA reductase-like NAD-dependent aldehyde dehydrogenase
VIESVVKGGYYHAGQVCVSVQRIFVQEDIATRFVERLDAKVRSLHVGDPLLRETDVGPLIHPREASRVCSWVEEAGRAGATVLGGSRLSETTLAPAIVVNPPSDASVSRLEIFGPVTVVFPFKDVDQALEAANGLDFAFQASVFSNDLQRTLHVARHLDVSTVLVNDHSAFRTDWMPFAGRRQSGYGTGGIPYSMRDMSEEKLIVMRWD